MNSAQQYGPWALISGGSEGVGAAFAHELAAAGIHLILVARRAGPLEETARAIRAKHGVEVRTLALDLTAPDMLQRVQAVAADVEIGMLVSNVGGVYGAGAPFVDLDLADVERTMRVNGMAHALLAHAFGKGMAARKRGGIVIVGSLAGNAGCASMVLYSAGKAFAQSLAEGLWAELEPLGVHVAYLVLGAVDTPARARQNLHDSEGQIIDDPGDIARFTLENLANGPVLAPAHLMQSFEMFSSMPRRQAAETMRSLMQSFMKN